MCGFRFFIVRPFCCRIIFPARVLGLQLYGFSPASVPEGFQRASGKPFGAPAGAYSLPQVGNGAPTTARVVGLPPHGFPASFGARRFPKGERKALWCARRRIRLVPGGEWRADYGEGGGLAVLSVLTSFGVRRFAKGERKALWCARRRISLLRVGNDAPTTAREQGLQPYGAFTLFFRWRKKSVQKKASGTATPGKRLLLPILPAGLVMSRAAWLDRFYLRSGALRTRLFPPSKWAGLFPSAAYRRPRPRGRRRIYASLASWDALMQLVYFCNAKGQRGFKSTLAFVASHEARRRMAVTSSQAASLQQSCAHSAQFGVQGIIPCREPRGLSPSGGKTPANWHVSLRPCAPSARSPVRGTAPSP